MAHVILDKSYLDAASKDEIRTLCETHTVLRPEVLFHELITTNENSKRHCFNKFPNKNNPVELIPNVGTLLRYELSNHQPCSPLYDRRVKIAFKFNDLLRDGTFKFTEQQIEVIKNRVDQLEQDTKTFFYLAMLVSGFFSHLKTVPYNEFPYAIDKAKRQIATEVDKVKEI